MKKNITLILIFILIFFQGFANRKDIININKGLAKTVADNFIMLFPDSVVYPTEAKSKRWNYEQGLVLDAFYRVYKFTGNKKYLDYIKKNLDYYIREDGSISTYSLKEYNIDNVTPGRILLKMYSETNENKYKKAADTLREQLNTHPRTVEGSFWHKEIYPYQVWLDGLYMGQPFYALYSLMNDENKAFDDITVQFINIYKHAKDPKTGLLYHAWDESKKQKWCNKETGQSPNFWGRAMGWYMMALVDVLDYIPRDHPNRNKIISILKDVSKSLLTVRDKKTKLWYQILDKGQDKRNYTEASASLMFIYAFAKGANDGYLDKNYLKVARESFQGVIDNLLSKDTEGRFNLNKVCKVSGLGGNPYRDGSLEYYFSEPVRTNDFKGYGPFILAALELEKGIYYANPKTGKGKTVGLDYYYNNERREGKRFHYTWEDETFSGFSELGYLFKHAGSIIKPVFTAPTKNALDSLSIYIIVDPDSPAESAMPNYISPKDINEITSWVKKGGVLALFANDSANCEFKNLNLLSEKFGITFNEDSKNRVTGKNFDMGKFDQLPNHPVFKDVKKLYLKEVSTLNLKNNAVPLLSSGKNIFIAYTKYGKGFVFAVGDPWLYNEYIDSRKLPEDFTNYKAAINFVNWLLEKAKKK